MILGMALRLYNTLTRKKEDFVPLTDVVSCYACGPTVYNYAHIGNLRTYLFEDTLKRVLLYNQFKVKHVMNITDVGHLTSDADFGEDKLLLAALKENKTVWAIAEYYARAFQEDLRKLNILSPDLWCKATEHIKEQLELIERLEKKEFTYQAGGNVYFDTSKLDDYGKLAKLDLSAEQKHRVKKDPNKRNPHDFVLWFTKSKFKEQEMKWPSKYGEGYPGWHLECSAMSMKYLGEQFDIHCGGIDHIPIHHTNEIAQSEAATGKKPWVKYWLHGEFLVLEKDKMAKSAGNFITLSTLEEKGFSPLDYRYFCLGTHYRKPLVFSYEAMEGAKNSLSKLAAKILEIKESRGQSSDKLNNALVEGYSNRFLAEINNDLNTPLALATLWEVLKDEQIGNQEKYMLILDFDRVLGLGLKRLKKDKISQKVLDLAKAREEARKKKDWAKSDQLRDKIKELGFVVEDSKEGPRIKKIGRI